MAGSNETATIKSDTRYGLWVPVCAAIVLLAMSGATYRAVASRFSEQSGHAPLPRGTLAALPTQIGTWVGRDDILDEAIVRATDTDDLLNRTYRRVGGRDTVGLYIAYGVRLRDLAPHRPEVCYPSSGWVASGNRAVDLELSDGSSLPGVLHVFRRGGFSADRVMVLSYYLVNGSFGRDASMVRSLAWQFKTNAKYLAQVQVTSNASNSTDHAERIIREFAIDSAPLIAELLTRAVAAQSADEKGSDSATPER